MKAQTPSESQPCSYGTGSGRGNSRKYIYVLFALQKGACGGWRPFSEAPLTLFYFFASSSRRRATVEWGPRDRAPNFPSILQSTSKHPSQKSVHEGP